MTLTAVLLHSGRPNGVGLVYSGGRKVPRLCENPSSLIQVLASQRQWALNIIRSSVMQSIGLQAVTFLRVSRGYGPSNGLFRLPY